MPKNYRWLGPLILLVSLTGCEGDSISEAANQFLLGSLDRFYDVQKISEDTVVPLSTHYLFVEADRHQVSEHDLILNLPFDEDLDNLQAQIDAIATQNVHGSLVATLPGHLKSPGLFITADFLYWYAQMEGLDFATVSSGPFLSNSSYKEKEPKFQWKPGVRAGLGYTFDGEDPWDLYLYWTHLHSTAEREISGTTFATSSTLYSGTIYPEWATKITGSDGATAASSRWALSFNALDLELGRSFFFSKKILFHPRLGIGAVKIDQKINVYYDALFEVGSGGSATIVPAQTSFIAHNDFKGIGLRFGADTLWHFSENWNLFGKLSGTLVEGKFFVRQTARGYNPTSSSLTTATLPYSLSPWRFRTNFEGGIGFGWETYFNKDKYRVALNLGYEMSAWFDQNQLTDLMITFGANGDNVIQPERRKGDLSMQGLTFQVTFNF